MALAMMAVPAILPHLSDKDKRDLPREWTMTVSLIRLRISSPALYKFLIYLN